MQLRFVSSRAGRRLVLLVVVSVGFGCQAVVDFDRELIVDDNVGGMGGEAGTSASGGAGGDPGFAGGSGAGGDSGSGGALQP